MQQPNTKPASTEEYFATLPEKQRAVLGKLQTVIRAAVPEAEDSFGYGMPAFKLDGEGLIWFSAWKKHYSLYPLTERMIQVLPPGASGYQISGKGTIRFPATSELPYDLIAELVKARAEEIQERRS